MACGFFTPLFVTFLKLGISFYNYEKFIQSRTGGLKMWMYIFFSGQILLNLSSSIMFYTPSWLSNRLVEFDKKINVSESCQTIWKETILTPFCDKDKWRTSSPITFFSLQAFSKAWQRFFCQIEQKKKIMGHC